MTSKFIFLRVRPAGHRITADDNGVLAERWLIAQWPDDEDEPVKYWLSSLPVDTDPAELIPLGKTRWRIEHDYRELKTGRPRPPRPFRKPVLAWLAPPVTFVAAAHLFITTLRLDPKRLRQPNPLQGHPRTQVATRNLGRRVPHCDQIVKPLHRNARHRT